MVAPPTTAKPCRICGTAMAQVFTARLLGGRHDVRFYACLACQPLRPEVPYWLAEAYAEAITRADPLLHKRHGRRLCGLRNPCSQLVLDPL